MNSNILLTGKPGSGKTTAIKRIIEGLGPSRVNGFWSSEIRKHGKRVGFRIETLSGESGILAHIDFETTYRVGKYGVNIHDIVTIIVPELESARRAGKLIIIDEIAKMEIYSRLFIQEVRNCLDTRCVIGTLQDKRHPFLDEVRARSDVVLIELTVLNRDKIPVQVLNLLNN